MMVVNYCLNKSMMKVGLRHHFSYKKKLWISLVQGGAVLLLFTFGFIFLFIEEIELYLSVVCFLFAIWGLLSKKLISYATLKAMFKGKPVERMVRLEVSEEGLFIQEETSETRLKWDGLIDFHPVPEGILLYLQEYMFLWVPEGEVINGTWEELVTLIQSKTVKRV